VRHRAKFRAWVACPRFRSGCLPSDSESQGQVPATKTKASPDADAGVSPGRGLAWFQPRDHPPAPDPPHGYTYAANVTQSTARQSTGEAA
jgi:hypothetical protein